jgi:hypothetical protein
MLYALHQRTATDQTLGKHERQGMVGPEVVDLDPDSVPAQRRVRLSRQYHRTKSQLFAEA